MNKDKNAAIDLLDDWMPRLFVGLAILVAVILVISLGVAIYNFIQSDRTRNNAISEIERTDAGKFAVRYFDDCKKSGITDTSNLHCGLKVIDGARMLQGDAFAKEVTVAVDKILEAVK